MNLLTAYQKLKSLGDSFSTRDVARLLNVSNNYAAIILARLAKQNMIVHLARGRWAYSIEVDPLLLVATLAYPMSAYVSLYSALYYHGMISQIPDTVFAITTGKTKILETPLAKFSFHSINPRLFVGYELYGKDNLLMATPEKALFDALYLIPAKSNFFRRLTEVELPEDFCFDYFDKWLDLVENKLRENKIAKELSVIRMFNEKK